MTEAPGAFDAIVLAGDSPDAFNDVETPNRVRSEAERLMFETGVVPLPPHSLTIVKVPLCPTAAAE
jgi:hypothetical protein